MTYELCDFNIYCYDPHNLAMTERDMTTAGRDQIQRLNLVALPELLISIYILVKVKKTIIVHECESTTISWPEN